MEKKNDVKDLKEEKDVKDEKKEHNSADSKIEALRDGQIQGCAHL